MDCQKCMEMIDRALDNNLDENEWQEFNRHLEECSRCKQQYTEMAALMEAVQNLPDEKVPGSFRSRWQKTIREEAARENNKAHSFRGILSRRSFQLVAAVAAVALIAIALPTLIPRFAQQPTMDVAETDQMREREKEEAPAEKPEEPEVGIMEEPQPEDFPEDEETDAEPRTTAYEVEIDDSNARAEFDDISAFLEENGIRHRSLEEEIAVKAEASELEKLVEWLEEYGFDFDAGWLQDVQEGEEIHIRLIIGS